MTDKELKKLSRAELLEMLIELTERNEELQAENDRLKEKLNDRTLVMDQAGSIAEAALRLNGVFEAAEKAANQYLESVRSMTERYAERQAFLDKMTAEEERSGVK